ncbi:MAG: RNA methyltransferase [Lachnospiraceae bacterium]
MITSTSNPQVKWLLQLQKKSKVRNEEGVFIVEGIRMFQELPKERVEKVYLSESFFLKKKGEWEPGHPTPEILSDHVFDYVSDTKTPQGILCVVRRKGYTIEDLQREKEPFLLVLDQIQDPGNLGTILRTAEGAGVNGIVMSSDCADIYNPKTIRSTMGSIYRMPVVVTSDLCTAIGTLKKSGVRIYAAHLEGKHTYDQEDYRRGCGFLIGNEGNGLREEIAAQADEWVRIPMHGQVESLNVAIASSVLMFEVCRQRRS